MEIFTGVPFTHVRNAHLHEHWGAIILGKLNDPALAVQFLKGKWLVEFNIEPGPVLTPRSRVSHTLQGSIAHKRNLSIEDLGFLSFTVVENGPTQIKQHALILRVRRIGVAMNGGPLRAGHLCRDLVLLQLSLEIPRLSGALLRRAGHYRTQSLVSCDRQQRDQPIGPNAHS